MSMGRGVAEGHEVQERACNYELAGERQDRDSTQDWAENRPPRGGSTIRDAIYGGHRAEMTWSAAWSAASPFVRFRWVELNEERLA